MSKKEYEHPEGFECPICMRAAMEKIQGEYIDLGVTRYHCVSCDNIMTIEKNETDEDSNRTVIS